MKPVYEPKNQHRHLGPNEIAECLLSDLSHEELAEQFGCDWTTIQRHRMLQTVKARKVHLMLTGRRQPISDLKAKGVMMHPGSHREAGDAYGVSVHVARSIRSIRTGQAKRIFKTLTRIERTMIAGGGL
jgi:hypothetical protein